MTDSSAHEPQLCRVSIFSGTSQVDLALPATVPVATVIPDVLRLIASGNPDRGEHNEGGPPQPQHWTLSRPGDKPIEPHRSLHDADVFDGELLVLNTVDSDETPALFDDVIDAVARLTESSFRSRTSAVSAWAGRATALATSIGACAMLVVSALHGHGHLAGGIGAGLGLLILVAAVLSARIYHDGATATALALCGLSLASTGAAVLVPGRLAAASLLLGSAVALLLTALAMRLVGTGTTIFAALVTAEAFGTLAVGVTTQWQVAPAKVAAALVVCALLAITLTPRLAVAAARLPVPAVPTAGGVIDPRDHEPRPTIAGIGAIGATPIPSAAGLEQRSRLANEYQSGMLLGIVAVLVTGTLVAAWPAEHRWQAVAFAAVTGLVLCRRSRTFADMTQAASLVAGGCAILALVPVVTALRVPALAVPCAAALVGVALVAVLTGVAAPRMEVSPLVQRLGEIVEYLAISAIGPLAFWIVDIYALARHA